MLTNARWSRTFLSQVDPSLHVTATYNAANCYPYRVASTSRTYYRCFAKSPGGINDPCFTGPRGTSGPLLCPADPTTSKVVILNVTPATTIQPPSTQTNASPFKRVTVVKAWF